MFFFHFHPYGNDILSSLTLIGSIRPFYVIWSLCRHAYYDLFCSRKSIINDFKETLEQLKTDVQSLYHDIDSLYWMPWSLDMYLTHLSRMRFPIITSWTCPFQFKGLWGVIFHFYSDFNRTLCKQTVKTLIRRRVLWRLILDCTVCRCPTKRSLFL